MKIPSRVAVGYVRVSTERQASEGVSLEAQEARIRGWAEAQGLQLASVHVDAGLSGGRADNRPALQEALRDVCKRRGVLVAYSLSRLARSTRDALVIAERLEKAGADLASLTEEINTSSAAGKMIFRLLAVLAEFERDLISERTTSAMDHLRRQGKRISGKIPFGYQVDDSGQLLPVAEEQATIALIHELRDNGTSLQAIADELRRLGIRTKTGLLYWTPATIRGVLIRDERLRIAA